MTVIVLIDYDKFTELFQATKTERDPWRRVAAYQYNVAYDMVTGEQRNAMKQLYFAYAYNAGPQKLSEYINVYGVAEDGITI